MKFSRTGSRLMQFLCALPLVFALAACSSGGDGGGGGTTPAASPSVGVFIDSPVQGLGYNSTPSGLSGLTNASGQYNYLPGDTVTFNLYGRSIGAAVTAGPVVTALSGFNATSIADPRVVNLSQLLLTLAGGAPSPGNAIVLPANAPPSFPATLDFSAPGFDTSFLPGLPLVPELTATTHLQANFSTLSVTLAGSGSVTSNPAGLNCGATCSADFSNGTSVTLTATGTGFTGWSGGCTGTGACVVTLNANTAVTATFTAVPGNANLTVTKAGNGAGTVTSSPAGINCGAICSAQLLQGTIILTANAANGSTFAGWSAGTGNANCTGTNTCSIPLTVDSTVTATFTLNAVPVSVTANVASGNGGSGTVTCSANGGGAGPCGSYLPGTAMVMTATPNTVSNFSGWTATVCSGIGTCDFTVTSATTVTANFNRPILTVQVAGTGSVSSNPTGINTCTTNCSAAFNKGTVVTLTAGAGLTGWSGGCSGTGTCQVTLTADTTVTANFTGLPPFALEAYLKASNTGANDVFGFGDGFGLSVALSGDTLAVGATGEDSAATGVNGNQADNSALESGAVYVFTRNPATGVWSQQAYLKASNTGAGDAFGISVALAGDTLAVGAEKEFSAATGINGNQADNTAPFSGAVYVFTRTGGVWSQQAYVKASNTGSSAWFGISVALAGDTLAVGAPQEASAATGVNGNQADNSAFGSGAVYVFTRTGGVWSQQAYVKASNTGAGDLFGISVALSGDTLAVGAGHEDSAATGVNGNQADNSALDSGAVYVFTRNPATGVWSQQAYLKASNTGAGDDFGGSAAISGDTLAVGANFEASAAIGVNGNQADNSAPNSGAVYVFTRNPAPGVWSQQAYLKASNTGVGDDFGLSLALSGDTLAVWAYQEASAATGVNGNQADNSAEDSGAVYLFRRAGGVWRQQTYVKASNTGAKDFFGNGFALSGDSLAVGAFGEDSAATGVGGNQADNSTQDSGAVYLYRAP